MVMGMQAQKSLQLSKTNNAQQYKVVKGPSGRSYYVDSEGKIIDPETGIIYDPSTNTMVDPAIGMTLDMNTGMVYDSKGNLIGTVPLSQLYGFMTVTSSNPQTERIQSPAPLKGGNKMVKLKAVGGKIVRTLDKLAGVDTGTPTVEEVNEVENTVTSTPMTQRERFVQRIRQARENWNEELQFFNEVMDALVRYVETTNVTSVKANTFLEVMYPNADKETKQKIVEFLRFIWRVGIVPPAK